MAKTLADIKKALDSNLGKRLLLKATVEEERRLNVPEF